MKETPLIQAKGTNHTGNTRLRVRFSLPRHVRLGDQSITFSVSDDKVFPLVNSLSFDILEGCTAHSASIRLCSIISLCASANVPVSLQFGYSCRVLYPFKLYKIFRIGHFQRLIALLIRNQNEQQRVLNKFFYGTGRQLER